jgi:orotidine-5'-phosphate decarboxylase
MATNFREMLEAQWAKGKFVCVGLDSDPTKIPECVRKGSNVTASIIEFNEKIIDATSDITAVYKPNRAFYAKFGPDGIAAFNRTVAYAHSRAPGVVVIDDSKYGDIGNTNEGYAAASFDDSEADAVTVSPYPGGVDLQPFLRREGKGIIVLCRMSTPGAAEFQERMTPFEEEWMPRREFEKLIGREVPRMGVPFYQYVAYRVTQFWNGHGNCGLVVGATCPDAMKAVREIDRKITTLMPGFGKQGGSVPEAIKAGKGSESCALVPSSSSAITTASLGDDFMEAAHHAVHKFHDKVTAALNL